jgi:hypothetical protein
MEDVNVALSTTGRKNTKYTTAPSIPFYFQNESIHYYSSLVEIVIGFPNKMLVMRRADGGSARWFY